MAAASAILNPRTGLEARCKDVDLPQGASLVPKLNFGMGRLPASTQRDVDWTAGVSASPPQASAEFQIMACIALVRFVRASKRP